MGAAVSARVPSTWSITPYSLASSAVRILSRSMSLRMSSIGASGVVGEDALHLLAHAQDLVGLDLDVRSLAAALGVGLVDEDPAVRERQPLARRTGSEQDRSGRSSLAEADGAYVRLDELHRVVDRRHRGVAAAGAVDVDGDLAIGVHRLQAQQLGHDVVRGGVVDLHAEEDDPLLEELGVGVVLAEPLRRPLDERGEDVARLRRLSCDELRGVERAHGWASGSRGSGMTGNEPEGQEAVPPSPATWPALRTTWSTNP